MVCRFGIVDLGKFGNDLLWAAFQTTRWLGRKRRRRRRRRRSCSS